MPRVFEITNGSLIVDLIEITSPGIIAERGGFGNSKFAPHQYYAALSVDDELFVERWKLLIKGQSHDNLATQSRNLISLLKQAYQHRLDPEEYGPVYIRQQTTNETNERYSKVYESPEISNPDFFAVPFEAENLIETQGVNIARFIWTHQAPGSLGNTLVVDPTDGPAIPTLVHVSNFRDDVNVSVIKTDDGGVFSSNVAGTASFQIFPSIAVVGDAFYIGATEPFKHVVFNINPAAVAIYDATMEFEYWSGATWTELVYGTDFTLYPNGDEHAIFRTTGGNWVISVKPPSDWATTAVDGDTIYWIRIRVSAVVSWTSAAQNATDVPYSQRTPEVAIPSTLIKGDAWPYLAMRMHAPAGGDENEGFSSLSRILVGVKNDPGTFVMDLNCGGDDNPSGWATTYGTDSASAADVESPGGKRANVTFATDATMIKRVILTGTAKLGDWKGKYRVFIIGQQITGAVGDTGLFLRTYIHETNVYSPKYDTETVVSAGTDKGLEIFSLGTLKIPFGMSAQEDSFTSADIIFEIHTERTTGSSTLRLYRLLLLPLDNDYGVTFDDPIKDSVNGSSALRGLNILEDDGGLIANRTIKRIKSGANIYTADDWGRGGPRLRIEPETECKLYFLMLHFPSGGTWGTGPFIASLGCHLAFELYGSFCYNALRGSD